MTTKITNWANKLKGKVIKRSKTKFVIGYTDGAGELYFVQVYSTDQDYTQPEPAAPMATLERGACDATTFNTLAALLTK